MKDKLFLDDEVTPMCRYPRDNDEDWNIVRSFTEFKEYILKNGIPKTISFDHDLGMFEGDGNDCAKWLVEYCIDNKIFEPNFVVLVHSMNPAGVERINNTFKYFFDYCNKVTGDNW